MRCNAFLSDSVAASFPTKVISTGISNSTLIPLFILVPVTCSCNCILVHATRIQPKQAKELV